MKVPHGERRPPYLPANHIDELADTKEGPPHKVTSPRSGQSGDKLRRKAHERKL